MRSPKRWVHMRRVMVLSAGFAASMACSGRDVTLEERQRLWGLSLEAARLADKAQESLSAQGLEEDWARQRRILEMSIDEVVARLGRVRYEGVASFTLQHNDQQIDVYEDSIIVPGSNGGWRVTQKDAQGNITRESVSQPDRSFIRNGPGKLRLQKIGDRPSTAIRQEAFAPLSTFTGWFGRGLQLTPGRPGRYQGRPTDTYRLRVARDAPAVEVAELDASLRPLDLKGHLVFDAETAVPVRAQFSGTLEVRPTTPVSDAPGRLTIHLQMLLEPNRDRPIEVDGYVPPIVGRAVDLDPLGFLDKETRTSTVIGGSATGNR